MHLTITISNATLTITPPWLIAAAGLAALGGVVMTVEWVAQRRDLPWRHAALLMDTTMGWALAAYSVVLISLALTSPGATSAVMGVAGFAAGTMSALTWSIRDVPPDPPGPNNPPEAQP